MVQTVLYRAMVSMREQFGLKRHQLRNTASFLMRDFPRMLDTVSRKTSMIVIVVDGADDLTLPNGHLAALRWLPFNFGPRIRIILTHTENRPLPPPDGISAVKMLHKKSSQDSKVNRRDSFVLSGGSKTSVFGC